MHETAKTNLYKSDEKDMKEKDQDMKRKPSSNAK